MLPPNPHEFRQRDAVYRRGVLLGMTMAEIMILLLFCLLMAFVLRLEEYEEIEEKIARIDEVTEAIDTKVGSYTDTWELLEALEKVASSIGLDALTEIVKSTAAEDASNPESVKETLQASLEHFNTVKDELTASTGEPASTEDVIQEMDRQIEESQQWRASSAERDAYQALKQALEDSAPGKGDPEQQANTAAALYSKLSQSFAEETGESPTPSELQDYLKKQLADAEAWAASGPGDLGEKYTSAIAANQELTDRVTRLDRALGKAKDQLQGKGQGLEYPSCFETPEGRIQYVYDVDFDEETVTLHELPVPGNEELKSRLPFEQITIDEAVGIEQYLAETRAVHQWSVENECRFFVRVFDNTSKENKGEYKRMKRRIEYRFYTFEAP